MVPNRGLSIVDRFLTRSLPPWTGFSPDLIHVGRSHVQSSCPQTTHAGPICAKEKNPLCPVDLAKNPSSRINRSWPQSVQMGSWGCCCGANLRCDLPTSSLNSVVHGICSIAWTPDLCHLTAPTVGTTTTGTPL
jgi:hypothetical protein